MKQTKNREKREGKDKKLLVISFLYINIETC